jgi:heme exporter protein C
VPRWRYALIPVFLGALLLALVVAPDDAFLKSSQRIFYIHVGAAWTGMIAYFLSFLYAVGYLLRRQPHLDRVSAVSAEVGTVLITAVLVSGSIWARVAWNTWWTWDPRLVTTAVLWFLYVGYLVLRGLVVRPDTRALVSGIFNVIAFLDVPLVYLSVHWWASIHPVIFSDKGMALGSPWMVAALAAFCVAMMLFFFDLLRARLLLTQGREELEALRTELRAAEGFDHA